MKLRINIITLFPDFFNSALEASLLGKAIEKNIIEVNRIQLRDFAINKHNQVDDTPYGGGSGMVLMVEPVKKAIESIPEKTYKVLLTPRGYSWKQNRAEALYQKVTTDFESLTLICAHYEGIDERVVEYIDESISIGDYILSGGEPAALSVIDCLARLVPNFMGNSESLHDESFNKEGYIEYPQYTRPPEFDGQEVPGVLLSGHHANITKWREEQAKRAYAKFKPV